MLQIRNFTPRPYQEDIVKTCVENNTLVVLPTGLGKTKVAILTAVRRLELEPGSFVIMVTPTRPLANQIRNEFLECTTLDSDEIVLLTGTIAPEKRQELYAAVKVIVATPQTIEEDVEKRRVNLAKCSLLVIDEAHRSRARFANTIVAKQYNEQRENMRIVALTASPGATKVKIDEVCANLFIDRVEIRSEQDEKVKEFVQEKKAEHLEVELPPALKEIHRLVKEVYTAKVEGLRNFGFTKPAAYVSKKDIILFQMVLQKSVATNKAAYFGLSVAAQAMKLSFALEMLETQGLQVFLLFMEKLKTEQTKAAQVISNDRDIVQAMEKARKLKDAGLEHPKILLLGDIVTRQMEVKPDARVIVFASYRNTVDCLMEVLRAKRMRVARLVGQKEGQSQKEQIETIRAFGAGIFNCLITTNIGEEGLSISEADTAIFYDNSPSSIRRIQRAGRVGRLKSGRIVFMITKGTRDEAYFWKAKRDEARMKNILYGMKDKEEKKQSRLGKF